MEISVDNDFTVIEKTLGPVVEIEERIPVWRMPATFGRDFKRIAEYLESQEAEVVGMPYGRYVDMDWEKELNRGKLATFFAMFTKKWHFYVGMPASKPVTGEAGIKSREMTNQRYARAVHRGPYKACGVTYKALFEWLKAQGLLVQNQAIECYANDPNEVDESDLETEILIPLKD